MVAWRKIIRYIFIPILAILLMSHNTFAIEPDAGVVFAYAGSGGVYTSCNYTWTTSMCTPTNPSLTGFSFYPTSSITLTSGSYWLEAYITFSSNGTSDAPLVVGVPTYSPEGTIVAFDSVSSTTRGSTTVRIYRLLMKWSGGTTINSSNYINISNSSAWVNTQGYMVNSFTFYKETTNTDATNQQIINAINNLNSTIESNTPPSAEEIADAVNAPEEEAVENIENQSTSDIDTGDTSSAMSIIGNMQNIVGIIEDVPLREDCVIVGNLGNINLGNINFCSGRSNLSTVADFGNAVFAFTTTLAGSIYLIRKTLKLIDWARGD